MDTYRTKPVVLRVAADPKEDVAVLLGDNGDDDSESSLFAERVSEPAAREKRVHTLYHFDLAYTLKYIYI